jgi:excisionase family DNA binding protein
VNDSDAHAARAEQGPGGPAVAKAPGSADGGRERAGRGPTAPTTARSARARTPRPGSVPLDGSRVRSRSWAARSPEPPPRRECRKPERLLISKGEAADLLSISVDTFERLVMSEVRVVRIGRRVLFAVADLERYVERHAAMPLADDLEQLTEPPLRRRDPHGGRTDAARDTAAATTRSTRRTELSSLAVTQVGRGGMHPPGPAPWRQPRCTATLPPSRARGNRPGEAKLRLRSRPRRWSRFQGSEGDDLTQRRRLSASSRTSAPIRRRHWNARSRCYRAPSSRNGTRQRGEIPKAFARVTRASRAAERATARQRGRPGRTPGSTARSCGRLSRRSDRRAHGAARCSSTPIADACANPRRSPWPRQVSAGSRWRRRVRSRTAPAVATSRARYARSSRICAFASCPSSALTAWQISRAWISNGESARGRPRDSARAMCAGRSTRRA